MTNEQMNEMLIRLGQFGNSVMLVRPDLKESIRVHADMVMDILENNAVSPTEAVLMLSMLLKVILEEIIFDGEPRPHGHSAEREG